MKATDASLAQRNKEIGWIKARQKAAGMTDDEYRAMLTAQTGKNSAADLDAAGRKKVLTYMAEHYHMAHKRGQRAAQAHKPLAQDKASIERKIAWQLGQLDKPWPYAYGVAKRILPEIEKFEFLTAEQLGEVSSALARTIRFKNKA